MAHMNLYTEFGKWYEVDTTEGTEIVPARVAGELMDCQCWIDADSPNWPAVVIALQPYCSQIDGNGQIECVEKWGCRYSANGYMDCTEWVLADTEAQAIAECKELYGDDEDEE